MISKKMTIFAAALAGLSATPALADQAARCSVVADVAGYSAMMRYQGSSQHQAAAEIGAVFSRMINSPEAQRTMSNQERHLAASEFGGMATEMLQIIYSMKKDVLSNPEVVAQVAYNWCMEY